MHKPARPPWAQLQQYEIVVPYSNSPFLDADTLGNNLADYVDGGGVVVQYGFSHYGPGQPYGVNGRWVSGNYNPYDYSTNLEFNAFSLGTFNAGHPLMAGVTTLNSNFAEHRNPGCWSDRGSAGQLRRVVGSVPSGERRAHDCGRHSLCRVRLRRKVVTGER